LFKSMKWKLVAMFVLLIISVMMMVGTFLFKTVSGFYHSDFNNQMTTAFQNEFVKQLQGSVSSDMPVSKIKDVLNAFSGTLGIDSFRNYYILNSFGDFVDGTDIEGGKSLEKSPNVIAAMTGKTGDKVSEGLPYMDFAYPVIGDKVVKYIVYIKQMNEELNGIIWKMLTIILQALGLGIIISILLGVFLSYTITTPISNLTKKAERIAAGDFEHTIEVKSKDELGELTNTFNYMANVLNDTLEEIASEKNKMETILQNMSDGVIAFSLEGNVIHINAAAKSMLGQNDTVEASFDNIFKERCADISMGDIIYLSTEKSHLRQIEIDGKYINAVFAPFYVEKDKIGGVTVVLHDVTQQQKLENARREFVANVSHELRTPLTTVKTYSETLLEGSEDKETTNQFLSVINSEADRMTRLVKDLLMLSRLDYGKSDWKKTRFSLDKLASEVVEKLRLEAETKGLEINYSSITDIPDFFGDRDRIEQVIINIVSNAIKYTPNGGKIDIFSGHLYDHIYLKIKDTGLGIPKKDLPRIFERFYRVDKARSREHGGTGLGLAIAKEIATAHGGDINITSEYGKGTEVIIKFILKKDES